MAHVNRPQSGRCHAPCIPPVHPSVHPPVHPHAPPPLLASFMFLLLSNDLKVKDRIYRMYDERALDCDHNAICCASFCWDVLHLCCDVVCRWKNGRLIAALVLAIIIMGLVIMMWRHYK